MLQGKNVLTIMVENSEGRRFFRVRRRFLQKTVIGGFFLSLAAVAVVGLGVGLTVRYWAMVEWGLPFFTLEQPKMAPGGDALKQPLALTAPSAEPAIPAEPSVPASAPAESGTILSFGGQNALLSSNQVALSDVKITEASMNEILLTGIFVNTAGQTLSGQLVVMLQEDSQKTVYFHKPLATWDRLPQAGESFSFQRARMLNARLPNQPGTVRVLLFNQEGRFLFGWNRPYKKSK